MAVMAMMMVVMMMPVVAIVVMMVPMVMPAPMHQLYASGGRLAACQHLRHSRGRRSLCRGNHHGPSQHGCGR
jgi:hypothetical protein